MGFFMHIKANTVASLRYTLKNSKGDLLDQADTAHPFIYLHGANNIVVGLEKELAGKIAKDTLQVIVSPEEGYGVRNDTLTQEIPRKMFKSMDPTMLVVGAQFEAQTNAGIEVITIVAVTDETVSIDANHPLAGESLYFDIEVLSVREASAEEIAHGHVHSAGSSCSSDAKESSKHEHNHDEGGCCGH